MRPNNNAPPAANAGSSYRWAGLVMILLGALTSYLCVYPAFALLQQGVLGASLSRNDIMGIGASPIALGYGLIYFIGGARAGTHFGPLHRQTMLGNLVGFALMALGVALFVWIDHRLKAGG